MIFVFLVTWFIWFVYNRDIIIYLHVDVELHVNWIVFIATIILNVNYLLFVISVNWLIICKQHKFEKSMIVYS